jgi:hypothetical protein
MNLYDLKEDKEMHLHIKGDHILSSHNFNVKIVNLDLDSMTIGLQFRDLGSVESDLLDAYINSFIEELENAA